MFQCPALESDWTWVRISVLTLMWLLDLGQVTSPPAVSVSVLVNGDTIIFSASFYEDDVSGAWQWGVLS